MVLKQSNFILSNNLFPLKISALNFGISDPSHPSNFVQVFIYSPFWLIVAKSILGGRLLDFEKAFDTVDFPSLVQGALNTTPNG